MSDHQQQKNGSSNVFTADFDAIPVIAPATDIQDLITFRIGRQLYALSLSCIIQIVPMVQVTSFPTQVSQALLGVINVHGTVVPVADLRRYLGQPDCQMHLYTPIILTNSNNRPLGLVVDEVDDVVHLSTQQLVPLEKIFPDDTASRALLSSMANIKNELIPVLSTEALFCELLAPEQSGALMTLAETLPVTLPENLDSEPESEPVEQAELAPSELPEMPTNGKSHDPLLPLEPGEGQPQ